MKERALSIAIVGAGIGGLTAGALLAARGHHVRIFDKFETARPVGSGLVVQPVGQAVLDEIGAGDAARAYGQPISAMEGFEAESGRPVLSVSYGPVGGSRFGLAIQRAALFHVIHDRALALGAELVTGREVTSCEDGSVNFSDDGSENGFDLVVDASGANSRISPLRAKPLPFGAVWGTVRWSPNAGFRDDLLQQRYRRADRMVGIMPSGRMPGSSEETATIFWSVPSNGYDKWHSEGLSAWREEIARIWPEALQFFGQIDNAGEMTFALYSHGTLKSVTGPRLAIIGDAAHRASPQLGQGANMAMLDGFALARALDTWQVSDALRQFTRSRRWHVRLYQALSWAFTPQYQSHSRVLPVVRDRMLFPLSMVKPAPSVLTRLVCGDLIPPLASLTPPVSRKVLPTSRAQ